jgi:hypothetical protein
MHTALVSRILKNPSLCEEVTLEGSAHAADTATPVNGAAASGDVSVTAEPVEH